MATQQCAACGHFKELNKDNFYFDRSRHRFRYLCILCFRAKAAIRQNARYHRLKHTPRYIKIQRRCAKQWRVNNPDRVSKNRLRLKREDPEAYKALNRRYYETQKKHPNYKERRRLWRHKNRKLLAKRTRAARLANPEKFKERERLSKARARLKEAK